jgi:DnaK suppressor protein
MTTQDREKLSLQIKAKIKRLTGQIVDLKELTKPMAPDCAIGRVSRMDAINNNSVNEAALRNKEEKLNKLKLALEDIDKDDFQNCIVCGKEIPIQRLFIMPESRKCMRCASKAV